MVGGSCALLSSCWQKHCHLEISQERRDNKEGLDQCLNQKIKRWENRKGKLGIWILRVSLARKLDTSIPMSKCSFWRVGYHQTASAWAKELSLGSTVLEVCVPAGHLAVLVALLWAESVPQGSAGMPQERRSLLSYGGKGSVLVPALVSFTYCYEWGFWFNTFFLFTLSWISPLAFSLHKGTAFMFVVWF